MRLTSRRIHRERRIELAMTSMIDLTFLLLIYSMTTIGVARTERNLDSAIKSRARSSRAAASDLEPAIVDVDSFALENVHEKVRDAKEGPGATLYLNIGHMVTNLSIVENGVTRVVRDMFISGNTMPRRITR